MSARSVAPHGHRFPAVIIRHAVWLYLRFPEARPGRTWHLDERAVRIGGKQHWLWRAVDEHGSTLEVLLQKRRDTDAAERFFRRLLGHAGGAPERITTDKLGSYAAAIRRLPELASVEHLQERFATWREVATLAAA